MRPAVKADGFEYYEEMILCYVDNILCICHNPPMKTMMRIKDRFALKNDEVKTPSAYLGSTLERMTNENGSHVGASRLTNTCIQLSRT